jgi:hypothetical protein
MGPSVYKKDGNLDYFPLGPLADIRAELNSQSSIMDGPWTALSLKISIGANNSAFAIKARCFMYRRARRSVRSK